MKNILLYTFFAALMFSSCSKKTATVVESSMNEVKETMVDPALAWRSTAPSPGKARAINLGEYFTKTLDNGMTLVVVENHKLPRVSYSLQLNNNQILEKDQVGFVSMAGDLLRTGTKTKSKQEIDAAIDFIGGSLNTSGSGMFGSSLSKHQDKLLDIMTDVLYNPSFPVEEFEKLKKQSISGLQASKADPSAMAGNVAAVLNFGKNHPYGEIQTEKHVENMTLENCKSYYNTFFRPNNAMLTIVGDITPAEAEAKVMQYFGNWKKGTIPEVNYDPVTAPANTDVSFVNKDGAVQSVIRITYPVELKPGSPDAIPASVMNSILGGGIFSGRLMQNLREDKAYTYGARSSLRSDKLTGNFNASASVRNEVTDSSIHEFIYELNRMTTENVSQEDLQLTKNSLSGGFARSLESPQTIARFANNIVRYNLPADYYETYLQKLEAVSIADVRRMATKYIRPENANIVVVGSKDDVAEKLVKFDSDGVIDYYDAFGNLLEVNNEEMSSDLTPQVILDDYFAAIGGKDMLMSLKSIEQNYKMDMMGQSMDVSMYQKAPGMFAMTMNGMGMTLQEQKFDGTKAFSAGMQQPTKVMTEGPEFEQMKSMAKMIPQLDYMSDGYNLELKGIETVDGEKCYKMAITDPAGKKSTEYYSVSKNLLMRSITTTEAQGQTMVTTSDLGDYKVVSGLMLPHKMTQSVQGMPAPFVMEATTIKVNSDIPADIFMIKE